MAVYEVVLVARIPDQTGPPALVEIGPIKHSGFAWSDQLDLPCQTADVSAKLTALDAAVKARLTEIDRTPNEIWIHRDGIRVFAGPLIGFEIQQRKTITLHAFGLAAYLDVMVRDTDYTATGVDQATIVSQLIDDHQAEDYGDFALDTSIPETGIPRDLTILARETKAISGPIGTMGKRSDGFDLTIDPTSRRVTLYSPRRGVDRSTTTILDRRNISRPSVSISVKAGIFASRVFAASTSVDGAALVSTAVDTDIEARVGRVMVGESHSDISEQATLDAHTERDLADLSTPAFVAAPELVPIGDLEPGDIAPGDLVLYDYDIGLGEQALVRRIDKVTVSVQKGRETMAVKFL